MLAVTGAALVSLIYPQASVVQPAEIARWSGLHPLLVAVGRPLQATTVFGSWWFLAVAALLLLNGALCLAEQIEKAVKLTRDGGFKLGARMAKPAARNRVSTTALDPERGIGVISKTLSSAGLRVRRGTHEAGPALLGVAHGWSQWGVVAFHVGLLLTLVSIVLVSLTFAKGQLRVVDGGRFVDRAGAYASYSRGGFGPSSLGGWEVTLLGFDPAHRRQDFLPGPASTLLVRTSSGEEFRRLLTRGEYLNVEGTNIFQTAVRGVAPVLTVTPPSGASHKGAVIVRPASPGRLPEAGFGVESGLTGRIEMSRETTTTSIKPELRLRLVRQGKIVFATSLKFHETVAKSGYRVTFDDLRYWSEFTAVRSPWLAGVNVAFWLLVFGASIMYFWPATYAWAFIRPENGVNVVYAGGRRERFSKEFTRLVERVKQDLAAVEEKIET